MAELEDRYEQLIRERYKKQMDIRKAELAQKPIQPEIFSPAPRPSPRPLTQAQREFAGFYKVPSETQPSLTSPAQKPIDAPFSATQPKPPVARSTVFNKARENLQKGVSDLIQWESPFHKDPMTGQMIERPGYWTEFGSFIEGPRVKPWEPLYNARNQEERNIAMKAFAESAGVMPGGESMQRSLQERLERSKIVASERIAGMDKPEYTGKLKRTDTATGTEYEVPYSTRTGEVSPSYREASQVPDHVIKQAQELKTKNQKEFEDWAARQDANTRKRLKELGF